MMSGRFSLASRVGWTLVFVVLGAVSIDFLLAAYGKYHHLDPAAYTMFWSRRGWLWTHLAGGALAIVLGPLQFLTQRLRSRPRLHRWVGRVYMAGILIAAAGATGLIATSQAPFEIRTAFAATALAWLSTALVALVTIRHRRIWRHRRWMIRNYLVTLSPATFRLLLQAMIATGVVPSSAKIAIMLWSSWLLPLLVYEGGRRVLERVRAGSVRPARIGAPIPQPLDAESA